MIRQIPNLLTIARLVLVPVVLRAVWAGAWEQALLWAAVAGATDALDGYLARRLHADSRTGAYLDPVADKLLLSGAYLVLALRGSVPWSITALVLGRDLLILLFVALALAFTRVREFPPSLWGKISTVVQVAGVLVVIASVPAGLPAALVTAALWAVAAATAWSAVHYAITGVRILRSSRSGR